ncbi:Hypothetical predicted protein [Podarcis lilfordi]|uniref:Uncharacterized protein n=1 Tax=Podarcis lilfordi TaxID=74358 RepID=A0AA35KA36_9SAUR|nr:Hypothetical predicted protein [Podarcis lilfordi]
MDKCWALRPETGQVPRASDKQADRNEVIWWHRRGSDLVVFLDGSLLKMKEDSKIPVSFHERNRMRKRKRQQASISIRQEEDGMN